MGDRLWTFNRCLPTGALWECSRAVRNLTCLFLEYNSTRNGSELGRICWEEIGSGSKIIGRHRVRNNYMGNGCPLWCQLCLACFRCTMPQSLKQTCLNRTQQLSGHLCLSGMWSRVGLRTDTKKDTCSKETGLCVWNMFNITSRSNSKRDRRLGVCVRRVSECAAGRCCWACWWQVSCVGIFSLQEDDVLWVLSVISLHL